MDEQQVNELVRLSRAVKALYKTVEHSYMTRTYEGTGKMMVKSYNGLHRKASELLVDDYYVTEGLELDLADDATEEEMIAQVRLALSQLRTYLQELTRSERGGVDDGDWGTMGRDLQDQILHMTRRTVRRAMRNIDLNFSTGDDDDDDDDEPRQDRQKRRIKVEVLRDDEPEPPESTTV